MAYAALVSLAQTITQILNHDEYSFTLSRKQQIASIHKCIISLQDFLENFAHKSNESLEGRITDIANQAEDIIEYNMYRVLETGSESEKPLTQLMVEIDSLALEVMGVKLNSISIIKEASLGKNDSAVAVAVADSSSTHDEPLHKKDALMVGLDDDLLAIKERLCGESSRLQVIPIVGMGGIGKTTLAQYAYHDPFITYHFQIRAWVTVSQDYSEQRILSSLLISMKEFNTKVSEDSNEIDVYQSLIGWKYLVVMDDVWSKEAWDYARRMFPNNNNGSRVMLTTRLSDVAAYADSSSHVHEMNLMDAHQSWNLLRQKVFAHQHCPLELEDIGKEIARSCRGLPLAIVVIAGLLSPDSNTRTLWEEIAENVQAAIATREEQFEKIMSLSYTYLPHHLRPCFLYMGACPEDYEIHIPKLIKLWAAEGFLKPSESKSLEETGEEYVEDLVKRNLVMVLNKKFDGKIKWCTIHDLMRKLCIRKAEKENFLVYVTDGCGHKRSTGNPRRVYINQGNRSWSADILNGLTIRTMITSEQPVARLGDYLRNCRLLRVLDVIYDPSEVLTSDQFLLPAQVLQLFHLRYLVLDYNVVIPAGIANLQNLQTLIIHTRMGTHRKPWFVRLPPDIWRMRQLRHLVCFYFDRLPNPEKDGAISCALENLQTLSAVADLVCTESLLKMILNLKKLGIHYFVYKEECHLENLVHLQQLEKLKLIVDGSPSFPENNFNLTFPMMLKKLTLMGLGLPWTNMMRIVGSLPNLEVLKLRETNFGHVGRWETSDDEFRQLKYLSITSSDLKYWTTESSHFPSLKCLLLHRCRMLTEIPEDIGEIPTLELIEVKRCSKAVAESAKRIQVEQQGYGNDALQVSCVNCN